MDLLRVASENAKEEIGEGLLLALQAIGKDNSIDEVTRKMENLGKSTGKTIEGLGVLIGEIKSIPGAKTLGDIVFGTNIFNMLNKLAQENSKGRFPTAPARETPAQGRILAAQRRQEAKVIKDGINLRKQEVKTLKEKTAVDQLKDKFDVERIGLTKALNEATDGEIKLRLRAQLAILDNNEALAKKILAEMAAAEAAKKFAASFDAALSSVMALTARINAFILKEGGKLPSGGAAGGQISYDTALSVARATNTRIENFLDQFDSSSTAATVMENASVIGPNFDAGRFRMGEERSMQGINITIDTAQTGDRFAQLIAESIQVAGRNGYSTTANGSL
jgi:hypothetical protein